MIKLGSITIFRERERFRISTKMTLFLLLITAALISSSSAAAAMNESQILIATEEMQRANYFTFVMLLNMAPPNAFHGQNLTFLMPSDRSLAGSAAVGGATVLDFLLRHSIPSPLLIDHLERIPTGSTIPASKPGFAFEVTNNGRRQFFLSNVKIISPNICTRGNSIRCHGIDGVAEPAMLPQPNLPPAHACAAPAPPSGLPPSDPALVVAPPPADDDGAPAVAVAPPPWEASGCRSTAVDLGVVTAVTVLGLFV